MFTEDERYSEERKNKVTIFKRHSKTNKTAFLVIVITYGNDNNAYKIGFIKNEVKLNDLFSEK